MSKDEWNKARNIGVYSGSTKDIEDGYIHFSEEKQVLETLKKYFFKQNDLILLKVHTLNLEHLLWEQASDGDMYPHLYSTLEVKNVKDVFKLVLNENGTHQLPENFIK